jgi:hypothetical protein
MKDIKKEDIRTAWQKHSDSDLYELQNGVVVSELDLQKLQGLNPELFFIIVKFDKKLLPENN